jgi:hypothetical protein
VDKTKLNKERKELLNGKSVLQNAGIFFKDEQLPVSQEEV